MSNYRRRKIEGGWYFFTVVTYNRRAFLTDDPARTILKDIFKRIQTERPFAMPVFCLLPNHLHCIWRLPFGDKDYSTRWALIKRLFSKVYMNASGIGLPQTASRQKKRELGIWQRRFWEHRIRDEDDYYNHVHYIHYNPVKHGLVKRPDDWPYSTYHKYRLQGVYDEFDWNLFEGKGINKSAEFVE